MGRLAFEARRIFIVYPTATSPSLPSTHALASPTKSQRNAARD